MREAIDTFIDAAARRGIPVRGEGLESVDPRWAELMKDDGKSAAGPGQRTLILLIGNIEESNNVAFTEAYRRRRAGTADLWIAGHESEPARRAASRLFADPAEALREAQREAGTAGMCIEVWVNPQESGAALEPLLAARAGAGKAARVLLLWNARNAGYLLARQAAAAQPSAAAQKKPDLILDIGVMAAGPQTSAAANGAKRIVWGLRAESRDLSIPLSRELWTCGRSHPTGQPPVESGRIDTSALEAAAALV